MTDIEKLRQDLNLVTLAEQAGAQLDQICGEWRGACPIHGGDNKTGFAIYESRGRMRWKCFTNDCNERGQGSDEFAFLMALTGKSFADVLKDLEPGKPLAPQTKREPTPDEIARRLQELERKVAEQEKRLNEIERWKERQPWQQYHDNAPGWVSSEWERAGIGSDFQSFWRLGGVDNFTYTGNDGQRYTTPTLTIPVWEAKYTGCATVRHRLLQPADPGDKYRPDMAGLGSHPFIADPDLGFDVAGTNIVVEGEKKAMVTFSRLDTVDYQVIGIPGKAIWRDVAQHLDGRNTYIILDPDARQQAEQMARDLGGARVVHLHHKIDDLIVENDFGRDWIKDVLKSGKMVK